MEQRVEQQAVERTPCLGIFLQVLAQMYQRARQQVAFEMTLKLRERMERLEQRVVRAEQMRKEPTFRAATLSASR
jgi:hypothetical protein